MTETSSAKPITVKGRQTDFRSPAFDLANLRSEEQPKSACTSCPAAIWYQRGEGKWRAFCNIMKIETYRGDASPVTICSARETAIARWEQERQSRTVR